MSTWSTTKSDYWCKKLTNALLLFSCLYKCSAWVMAIFSCCYVTRPATSRYYEWMLNRKCLFISIPYHLADAWFYIHVFHLKLFSSRFDTNKTLCLGSWSVYNQKVQSTKIMIISGGKKCFSDFYSKGLDIICRCVVWKWIFWGRGKVLSTTFHLLCDSGLHNWLWFGGDRG